MKYETKWWLGENALQATHLELRLLFGPVLDFCVCYRNEGCSVCARKIIGMSMAEHVRSKQHRVSGWSISLPVEINLYSTSCKAWMKVLNIRMMYKKNLEENLTTVITNETASKCEHIWLTKQFSFDVFLETWDSRVYVAALVRDCSKQRARLQQINSDWSW